jgi:hypothetical protein
MRARTVFTTSVHVVAGYAQLSGQPALILLCPLYAPLSSRPGATKNDRAASQPLASGAKALTSTRSIYFPSSVHFLRRANVVAKPLGLPNVPLPDLAPPVSARDSSNGLPWEAAASRQRGVLSTIQSQWPAAAILLRAFPRARDASLHAQILPPESTAIFLVLYRALRARLFLAPA